MDFGHFARMLWQDVGNFETLVAVAVASGIASWLIRRRLAGEMGRSMLPPIVLTDLTLAAALILLVAKLFAGVRGP